MIYPNPRFLDTVEGTEFLKDYVNTDIIKLNSITYLLFRALTKVGDDLP